MPRPAKPWPLGGFYVTNALGRPKEKLCPLSNGMKRAKELLRARLAERDGYAIEAPKVRENKLVEDVYGEYISFVSVENDEDTHQFYVDKLKPFLGRFRGKMISALTLEDGLRYKTYLLREKPTRKGKGLSPRTVNHHIRAAKTLLNWAKKPSRAYVTQNPWEEIGYNVETHRERVLSDEEFSSLLSHCEDGSVRGGAEDFREQLRLLRATTLRPGELRELRWEYIRWSDHQVVFPAPRTKVKRRRSVSLTEVAEEILQVRWERKKRPSTGFIFTLPAHMGGKLTAGGGDKPITANGLSQRFRRLVERCVQDGEIVKSVDGESITPYHTRRTRISELVRADLPFRAIMEEAGHSNPKTTEIYVSQIQRWVTEQVRGVSGSSRDSESK